MADAMNMAILAPNATQHKTETRLNLTVSPWLTERVIGALRDGLGVEDMHALHIADIEYARTVVRRLAEIGLIDQFYRPTK